MKQEQIESMQYLGAKGSAYGELWGRVFESAFFIHGHVCGGMPLGFRAGLAALKALEAERELNMAKYVFVETGTGHAAGCFADGVQMATGCTFGKGLIERTEYGKWALTLVDKGSRKAVRVAVLPAVMQASFQSPFVKMRHDGVTPVDVPIDISQPLVEGLLQKTDAELFSVSAMFEYPLAKPRPASFNLVTCSVCAEVVAENKVRLKDGQPVCQPCSGYAA